MLECAPVRKKQQKLRLVLTLGQIWPNGDENGLKKTNWANGIGLIKTNDPLRSVQQERADKIGPANTFRPMKSV